MNKLAKAVFTLTSFSVIDRALGFIFKIYLSREMGATDLGIYQVALSFFFVLMTLTTSGLPLIEGKMTAAFDARGLSSKTSSLVSAGLLFNTAVSFALVGLVGIFYSPLSAFIGNEASVIALIILLPSLIFCSIAAAFRGPLWGKEKYAALSIIELSEQIVRIILCVALFAIGIDKINAAVLSLAIAMAVSAITTVVYYFMKGGKLASPFSQLKPLVEASTPISTLRASSALVNSLLAAVIPFLFMSTGLSEDEALAMFGATVGMALPLLFLPLTVIGSLSYAMIPSLARADAAGNKAEVKRQAELAIKVSILVSAVFLPLFAGLGYYCGIIIYDNEDAGRFIAMGACLLLPIALESITSSMMNSLGMEKQGFLNSVIGSAVMFGVLFCFYGNFSADVLCLAMFISLLLSTVLDVICIRKHTGLSFGFIFNIVICVGLAVPCCFLASGIYNLLSFMPALLALAIAAIVGCGTTLALFLAFGLPDTCLAYRKRKKGNRNPAIKRENICKNSKKSI